MQAHGGRRLTAAAISRYEDTLPTRIVFKAVEGTLQMPIVYFAEAQFYASMGTAVQSAPYFPLGIAPENQFLAQSDYSYGFFSNLIRI
jgi:hypothetical protein